MDRCDIFATRREYDPSGAIWLSCDFPSAVNRLIGSYLEKPCGEGLLVHSPVPSSEVIEALIHIRDLFRRIKPRNEHEQLAVERREAASRDLLSNLPRIDEHPTLRTLLEIAEIYSLTLDGVHRLFGYSLPELRTFDLQLNTARTHIFESYAFERDLLIDVPARLAPRESFTIDALLRDLVVEWQTDIPIRALDEEGWDRPGAFYVHVGTDEGLGSSIPPGATARVEPVSDAERALPNPRHIYLLQFANGYRCSHCVVAGGKLRPFNTGRSYLGREEFAYPGSVRIAGRIRMFALRLPSPEYSVSRSVPPSPRGTDLILPWEHPTRDRLFATKHRRFRRTREEERVVQEYLKELLHAKLSKRSARRYRRPTSSEPHVNSLIHLAIEHVARYTDALRTGGSWQSDRGRLSLEGLLHARSLEEASVVRPSLREPTPTDVWEARREEFGGWPPIFSARFPRLRLWEDNIVRLAHGNQITGLDPTLGPGSLLFLEEISPVLDARAERVKSGWSRPIYVLRRGTEIVCGHLEKEGNDYALLAGPGGAVKASFRAKDLLRLSCVAGVAVPV